MLKDLDTAYSDMLMVSVVLDHLQISVELVGLLEPLPGQHTLSQSSKISQASQLLPSVDI
jgi:hypothetical protein